MAVVLPFWLLWVISQKWQKILYFVITSQKNTDSANFWPSIATNCEFLPSEFQYKNWTAIFYFCNGMWNLSVVLLVWLWLVIYQKWQKRPDFVVSAQKQWFCHFLAINCEKLCTFTSKFLMEKLTSYPSYLWWYAKLGSDITGLLVACHFPKVTKRIGFCHQRPKTPIMHKIFKSCNQGATALNLF